MNPSINPGKITIVTILCLGCLYRSAQTQPVSAAETQAMYRTTQQVCQQLATAFGERRLPKLTLVMDPGSGRIAQFVPKPEPELFLDAKVFAICRHFGADSLAALSIILGHELTHYYGKHADWFGFAQLAQHQQPSAVQTEQTQMLEAQADMQGIYRAFLAGYNVYRLVKPLYRAIYDAYQLPVTMTGYPSREERIQLADEQARKANGLAMGFDAGLFFLLKRDYTVAQRCFDFVSEEMPIKEVLNNVGLCQFLRATQVMTLRETPFRYPFEMETSNRLRQPDNRGSDLDKVALLKQAVSYFQQAIDLDETYVTAYINQASALSMLGRTGTAKETIDQLEEVLLKTRVPLPPNARMVRGIALVEAGNEKEGVLELERSLGAQELPYNLDVARSYARIIELTGLQTLTELADRYAEPASNRVLLPETSVGAIQVPFSAGTTFLERLAIPEPGMVRIQSSQMTDGILLRLLLPTTKYDVVYSQPGTTVQSRLGITSGNTVQRLVDQYGEPPRVVAANGLIYYCYDSAHVFFAVRDGVVLNWIMYTAY